MRLPSIVLFVLLLASFSAGGQHLRRPLAAAYTGFGAYSQGHADLFSFTSNQASLMQIKEAGLSIYAERKFMLPELNFFVAAAALPTQSGNFGLKAAFSGFSAYNESQLSLAYAHQLGKNMDIGAQFNYNGISIEGYGSTSAISFELGLIIHISEKLHSGLHVNNPVGGRFGKEKTEKLASVYTVGFGYEASPKVFLSAEIIKEEDQRVNLHAGIQYRLLPFLLARMGVSAATSATWMGVGLSWKTFRLDVTTSYHQHLGITPGLLLIYHFKSVEK